MTESSGIPPLSANMTALLRNVVERHSPDLVTLIDILGVRPLTKDDREALRGAVASELTITSGALDSESEPTPFGLQLEELIDALGHC
jgi:hypothetical protein